MYKINCKLKKDKRKPALEYIINSHIAKFILNLHNTVINFKTLKMENALAYEYLIRRVHQCGRYGVEGADADIYRELENAEVLYRTGKEYFENGKLQQQNKSLEYVAFDYGEKCGEITVHIKIAIEKIFTNYSNNLNDEQKEELENCKIELIRPDLSKIKNTIEKVEEIILKIGVVLN